MADINIQNNLKINQEKVDIKIDQSVVKRTLKHLAAPVFEFFTKEQPQETQQVTNYDDAIAAAELQQAKIQKILNDSDPQAKTSLNIVI